ncbi:MAG: LysR family transcriptional regulator [Mangrovicoccus sp.]
MSSNDIYSLDGRLLRLFLTIYDHSSVSRAADELELNQSTVSHGLDRLRKVLGDPLFVKAGRGITPSQEAIMLAPRIREILASLEGLGERHGYDPTEDQRMLTIAVHMGELMPEMLAVKNHIRQFSKNIPIRFLHLGPLTNVERVLERGEADLVICVSRHSYATTLTHQHFFSDRIVSFYDPSCRGPIESLEDYASARHAALDFGGTRSSILGEHLMEMGLERQICLYVPNVQTLAIFMPGTDLVATMQERFANHVFKGLAKCEVPFNLPRVNYDIVWHRRVDNTERSQWLRNIVLQHAPLELKPVQKNWEALQAG